MTVTLTVDLLTQLSKACGGRPNRAVVQGIVDNQHWLVEGKIDNLARLAAWAGQACVETDYFKTLKEYWGPSAQQLKYDPASGSKLSRDLGNTKAGDGKRFMGRGVFQETGRFNYETHGEALGIDLVANPERAATPEISVRLSVLYWNSKKLSPLADKGNIAGISRAINRGSATASKPANHEAERIRCTAIAREVLGGKPAAKIASLLSMPEPVGEPEVVDVVQPEPPVAEPENPEITKQVIVNETYTDEKRVRRAQEWLRNLGYTEVATPDGKVGPFTRAAIRAYRADKGLPLGDYLDTEMFTMLAIDNEPRALPKERTEASSQDIREKVPEVRANFLNKIWAQITAGFFTLVAFIKGIVDNISGATEWLDPVKTFLGDIPPWAWTVAVFGVAGGFFILGRVAAHGEQAGKDAYKDGSRR